MFGAHNTKNILAAITAANVNGISIQDSVNALKNFKGIKRRLELKYEDSSMMIIDDFAHHPTAIQYSIDAVKNKFNNSNVLGLIELGSNTMSDGIHGDEVMMAASALDMSVWLDSKEVLPDKCSNTYISEAQCIEFIIKNINDFDILLIMTNKNSARLWGPIIEHIKNK